MLSKLGIKMVRGSLGECDFMDSTRGETQKWGLAVAARRGRNKAAVAVARKLCVALWHVMIGHAIGTLERLDTLQTKLSKFATEIGPAALTAFGYNNKADFVEKK